LAIFISVLTIEGENAAERTLQEITDKAPKRGSVRYTKTQYIWFRENLRQIVEDPGFELFDNQPSSRRLQLAFTRIKEPFR
jgi:hypothetical protein